MKNRNIKLLMNSLYGTTICDAINKTLNLGNIIDIISLYYNGLSERTLNKRYKKDEVKAALHNPRYEVVRKHMQEEKREAFKNYWKQEGISKLAGDN